MNSMTRYIFSFLTFLIITTNLSQAQSNTPQLRKIEIMPFRGGKKSLTVFFMTVTLLVMFMQEKLQLKLCQRMK
jgi:hypothetical protein